MENEEIVIGNILFIIEYQRHSIQLTIVNNKTGSTILYLYTHSSGDPGLRDFRRFMMNRRSWGDFHLCFYPRFSAKKRRWEPRTPFLPLQTLKDKTIIHLNRKQSKRLTDWMKNRMRTSDVVMYEDREERILELLQI